MTSSSDDTYVAPGVARSADVGVHRRWMRAIDRPWVFAPAVLLLFTACAVGLQVNVWRAPLTHIDGTQDALQSIWFMSWPPYALSHHHNPLFSNYLNYPAGVNLLWNTSVIAPAILTWPITTVWNAVLSYNVLMTASMALAGLFAFLAVRRYVPSSLAAVVAGAIYGFSPYVIAHETGHLHSVVSAVTPPLALLLVDELYVRQRMRFWLLGLLLALLGAFQFFTHEEVFVSEVIVGVLLTVLLVAFFPGAIRGRLPYAARSLAVGVLLLAAVLAYPVHFQLFGPEKVHGTIHNPDVFATDLLNMVVPDHFQFFAPAGAQSLSNQFTGNLAEVNGYLGIPLVLLMLAALIGYWRVAAVRIAALTGIAVAVLSMGPHLHVGGHVTGIPLPWWVAARIPLVSNVIPARLTVFVYLAAGIVVAYTLTRVAAAVRWGPVLALGIAALAMIPLVPAFPFRSLAVSTPTFFTTSAAGRIPQGALLLQIPWASSRTVAQMDAMTWAAESHMRYRVIGGYFLNPPSRGQAALHALVDGLASVKPSASLAPGARSQVLGLLGANRVGVVVLEDAARRPSGEAALVQALGSPALNVDGNDVWILPTQPPP